MFTFVLSIFVCNFFAYGHDLEFKVNKTAIEEVKDSLESLIDGFILTQSIPSQRIRGKGLDLDKFIGEITVYQWYHDEIIINLDSQNQQFDVNINNINMFFNALKFNASKCGFGLCAICHGIAFPVVKYLNLSLAFDVFHNNSCSININLDESSSVDVNYDKDDINLNLYFYNKICDTIFEIADIENSITDDFIGKEMPKSIQKELQKITKQLLTQSQVIEIIENDTFIEMCYQSIQINDDHLYIAADFMLSIGDNEYDDLIPNVTQNLLDASDDFALLIFIIILCIIFCISGMLCSSCCFYCYCYYYKKKRNENLLNLQDIPSKIRVNTPDNDNDEDQIEMEQFNTNNTNDGDINGNDDSD